MVEIPEHLLERSRAARARLTGQAAPEPEPAAPEPADEAAGPEPATAEAPAQAPAAPEPAAPEPVGARPVEEEPAPEAEPALPSVPEPVAAGGAAFAPPEPLPPGAAIEVGVRTLAARVGSAAEPLGSAPPRPPAEGDINVETGRVSAFGSTRAPRWLTAVFAVLPVLALVYILQYMEGPDCGEAGALGVNAAGEVVDCDGEALGADREPSAAAGRRPFLTHCAVCHGNVGEGGVGLSLDASGSLFADFPAIQDQFEFVRGGTAQFPVYGAQDRQAGAVAMPGFPEAQLDEFTLRSIIMFERHELHGIDPADPGEQWGDEVDGDDANGEDEQEAP